VGVKIHTKLTEFLSLQSKLVLPKTRRLKVWLQKRSNLNLTGEVQRERGEF